MILQNDNFEIAQGVVSELIKVGVREFVLCAGARNSPFIVFFEELVKCPDLNLNIKLYPCFEERSAAFFAVGRIQASGSPVAVFTTSGTAVAELLPAAIEAYYSGLPLILVTADRPMSFRGTGAPQSIEQVGIFSNYIEKVFDIAGALSLGDWNLKNLSFKKPMQINVCLEEPLLNSRFSIAENYQIFLKNVNSQSSILEPSLSELSENFLHSAVLEEAKNLLSKTNPLVLVGPINEDLRPQILLFLKQLGAPVYAEGISNLRGHSEIEDLEIPLGDILLKNVFTQTIGGKDKESEKFSSVLRLGGVPTLRLWRDLETSLKSIPVISISDTAFSGLSRPTLHFNDYSVLPDLLEDISPSSKKCKKNKGLFMDLSNFGKNAQIQVADLFLKYPKAEPSLVNKLSKIISTDSLYLGNSLPIREWDLFADPQLMPNRISANRGANGIDGQISSYLGWGLKRTGSQVPCWGLFGDLTALYDLTSLWLAPYLPTELPLRIVIINNKGGQIFNRMFNGRKEFLNPHDLNFSHWAKMWNWDYQLWSDVASLPELSPRQIIEITPCFEQTAAFWKEFESISFERI